MRRNYCKLQVTLIDNEPDKVLFKRIQNGPRQSLSNAAASAAVADRYASKLSLKLV